MGKLSKAIKALAMILRRPVLLNRIISDPDSWKEYVAGKYSLAMGLPQVDMGQLTGEDDFSVEPVTFLDGGSLPTDMALLKLLAGWFSACTYFEIGTWRGESVANLASVARVCYSLNLSDEQMRQRGISEDYIGVHRHFSRGLPNVTHLQGDSRDFDFAGLGVQCDLVFIDGDHHYDFVKNDTAKVLRHLVHEKSIIVWHDYAYDPEELRYEVLAGILDSVPSEQHRFLYHIEHTKCAVYIGPHWHKEFRTRPFRSPVIPDQYFRLKLDRVRMKPDKPADPIKLMVIPSWYPPDGGYFFREHAQVLAGQGARVDVLVNRLMGLSKMKPADRQYMKRYETRQQGNIREIRTHTLKVPYLDRFSVRRWINRTVDHCERFLKQSGTPDLIVAHSAIWAGAVAETIAGKYGIPYVIIEHRSRFIRNTEEARALLPERILPLLEKSFTLSREVITVSENLRQGLLGLFPQLAEKTISIPNMVDTGFFTHPAGTRSRHPFRFLYTGILEHVKGLDTLLLAFRKLSGREEDIRLKLVGRGSLRKELGMMIEGLGLSAEVEMTGYLDRDQLLEAYRQANVFVLPSRYEAFGVVLIEAMAAGLPVIATRSGGPEEVVTKATGRLVPIDDPDALSEAMAEVMDQYDRYRPHEIRQYVAANYSRETVAGKYMKELSRITGKDA